MLPALDADVHAKSMLDLFVGLIGQLPEVLDTAPGRRQFNNMLRLMDKTVNEYEMARQCCEAWIRALDDATGVQVGQYLRAVEHMENCIGALHRTLLHLERISRQPAAPPIDRNARRALDYGLKRINDMRDCIEHFDEELLRVVDDQVYPPMQLGDYTVAIGDDSIRYDDLARWILQTFRLVRTLLVEAEQSK